MGLVILALAAILDPSSAAALPSAWSFEDHLESCDPSSLDEASKCTLKVLTTDGLARVDSDLQFRKDVGEVLTDAWNLRDPQSKLSVGLAKEKLYHVALSAGSIIAQAEAMRNGRPLDPRQFAALIAQITNDEAVPWSPGVPSSWRELPLKSCPKLSNSGDPKAKCFVRPDGTHVVVTP